jgi:hypothetical protein
MMKNEFLYTMRMYVLNLLQLGDMLRLKELFTEYKFLISWEEERQIELNRGNFKMSYESAYTNLLGIITYI